MKDDEFGLPVIEDQFAHVVVEFVRCEFFADDAFPGAHRWCFDFAFGRETA